MSSDGVNISNPPPGFQRPPVPPGSAPSKQIYLLQQTDPNGFPHARFQTLATVVRAACETCARSVAAGEAGAEGPAVWRDPERSTCKLVKQDGKSGVVLRSEG